MGKKYTPSHKFNLPLLLAFFLITTIVSCFFAFVAAFLGLWLVPPYTGILFAVLCGIGMTVLWKYSLKFAKTRNVTVARIFVFLSSLIVLFIHVSALSSVLKVFGDTIYDSTLSVSFVSLKQSFIGAFAYLLAPAAPFQNMIHAGGLWIVYLIIIIFAFLILTQLAVEQAKKPFNEEFKQWMDKSYSVVKLELIPDREQRILVTALDVGDLNPLLRQPSYSDQLGKNYSKVVFYKVKNQHTGYVAIENFHQEYTKKGQPIEDQFQIIEFTPPIQIGRENSEKLETSLHLSSGIVKSASFSTDLPEPVIAENAPEESGYKVYRSIDASPPTLEFLDSLPEPPEDNFPYYPKLGDTDSIDDSSEN